MLIILLYFSSPIFAQSSDLKDFGCQIYGLTKFIISNHDKDFSDLDKTDKMYEESNSLSNSITSESLLLATLSSLPYRKVPIRIPLFNIYYKIPLPSVEEKSFNKMISSLPGHLFFDTIPNGSDKDKLTHFFGNAFLSYNFPHFNFSEFIGILIELFEESYISKGEFDLRDMMVNGLGAWYGLTLLENQSIPPSVILSQYSLIYFRYY